MKHIFLLLMLLNLTAQPRRARTALLALTGNVQTGAQQVLGRVAFTLIHALPGQGLFGSFQQLGALRGDHLPCP